MITLAAAISRGELVREVLVLYESMGVAIDARLSESVPSIYADPAMLRQVLHNLFQNAIDANHVGAPAAAGFGIACNTEVNSGFLEDSGSRPCELLHIPVKAG